VVAAVALAEDLNVLRLGALLALGDVELDLLPFIEAAVAATGDRAEVHEHIRATFNLDEPVALVAVEPLHRSLRHLDPIPLTLFRLAACFCWWGGVWWR
jgi:hypothetical protein